MHARCIWIATEIICLVIAMPHQFGPKVFTCSNEKHIYGQLGRQLDLWRMMKLGMALKMAGSTFSLILQQAVYESTMVEKAFMYHASHPEKKKKTLHTLCNLLQYCLSPKFKRCLWPWNVYVQHFHLGSVISFLKNWLHVEIIVFGFCGRPEWSFINTECSILFSLNFLVEDSGAKKV